jgi:transposase InsO family protein
MDIFSRKIVGWAVHDEETSELSATVIDVAARAEGTRAGLVLHSDNGGPMKGSTMMAKLQALGITSSFSRPSVSNDNPFSESLFRTLKYRPNFPDACFASLDDARSWVDCFVRWYNNEHRHSALKSLTPDQRHKGQGALIMARWKKVLEQARAKHPERWSGRIRNLDLPEKVELNPPRCKTHPENQVA